MKRYDICPVPAPRMSKQDRWGKRPAVQRFKAFGQKVRLARVELPQPCRVVFYLPMPKSWSAKKSMENEHAPHESKPDLDNLLKGLIDAVFYKQKDADKRIWSVWAEKRWTDGTGHFTIEAWHEQPVHPCLWCSGGDGYHDERCNRPAEER